MSARSLSDSSDAFNDIDIDIDEQEEEEEVDDTNDEEYQFEQEDEFKFEEYGEYNDKEDESKGFSPIPLSNPLPKTNDEELNTVYVPIVEVEQYDSPNVALAALREEANYEKSTSIPLLSNTNKRSRVNKEDTAMNGIEDNNSNIVVNDKSIDNDLWDLWQPMGDNDDDDGDTRNQDLLGKTDHNNFMKYLEEITKDAEKEVSASPFYTK